MDKRKARRLREEFEEARRKGKTKDARRALDALRALEPNEPRWPHQLGELCRRADDPRGAADALEIAADLYVRAGFIARAVATAKIVLQIDPTRTHVLERVDPQVAREKHREARPDAVRPNLGADPLPQRAPVLATAPDAEPDEVRFIDLEGDDAGVIELDLSELEIDVGAIVGPGIESIDRLARMPSFPLFAELAMEHLHVLARGAELVELGSGARVVRRGEPADALYCIVEGSVQVQVPGLLETPSLTEGEVFGESCLLGGGTRQADVIVDAPLTALRISRAVLDEVRRAAPQLDDLMFEILARRVLSNFLAVSPLFAVFDPIDRRALAKTFELRRAAPGLVLLAQGKRSDALYVLVLGRVVMDGHEVGPGAILGVKPFLASGPAEVTATTVSECVLLRLPTTKLMTFVTSFPPAVAHLAELTTHADDALARRGMS